MIGKYIAAILFVFYFVMAVADFHARGKDHSSIRDSWIASILTPEIVHKIRLANALAEQAGKSRQERKKLLRMAEHYANRAISWHPNDPRGYATLWKVKMMQGKRYAAYAAISRAVALDPLFGVNLEIQRKTKLTLK